MMKFYTMAWWCGTLPADAPNAIHAYQAYLKTVADQIPQPLLALQESFAIHDSRLVSLSTSDACDAMTLVLDGDDGHGEHRRFTLTYTGLVAFDSAQDPEGLDMHRAPGYGDLGYYEVDVEANHLVHRILFSSGITLRFVFREFHLS